MVGHHESLEVSVVNTQASHLSKLSLSLHRLLHLSTISASSCASLLSLFEHTTARSFAKVLVVLAFISLRRSSMKRMKSMGDKTAPCGRPTLSSLSLFTVLSILTLAVLLWNYSNFHLMNEGKSLQNHLEEQRFPPDRVKRPLIIKDDHCGPLWRLVLKAVRHALKDLQALVTLGSPPPETGLVLAKHVDPYLPPTMLVPLL